MHLGTSNAKPRLQQELKVESARTRSRLGRGGHQSAVRQPKGPVQLWAAFYCRNADPGWSFCTEHQVPTYQRDLQNLLQQEVFSMQRCCAGTNFHTALVCGVYQRPVLAQSDALNELFYLQQVTASSRGIRAAQQSSPAALLLKRITVGIH